MPNVFKSSVRLPLSRIRSTIFSPKQHGQRRDAESITREPILSLMRPSAARGRSAMFQLRHDLQARRERGAHFTGASSLPAARAVDAVADAHLVFERLDVNVGGAPLDGIGEQPVDQTSRRARRRPGLRLDVLVLLILDDLEILGRLHGLEQGLQLGVRLLVVRSIALRSVYSPAMTGKTSAAGDELDVFDRRHVVGIAQWRP